MKQKQELLLNKIKHKQKMTDNERIKELKKYLELSGNALAKAINLKSPQIFYDIKAGKCGISKDLAIKIQAKFLNINLAWLLAGEGEMLKTKSEDVRTPEDSGSAMDRLARAVEIMAESNKILAESNKIMAESNKILAGNNTELVKQLSAKRGVGADVEVADVG